MMEEKCYQLVLIFCDQFGFKKLFLVIWRHNNRLTTSQSILWPVDAAYVECLSSRRRFCALSLIIKKRIW